MLKENPDADVVCTTLLFSLSLSLPLLSFSPSLPSLSPLPLSSSLSPLPPSLSLSPPFSLCLFPPTLLFFSLSFPLSFPPLSIYSHLCEDCLTVQVCVCVCVCRRTWRKTLSQKSGKTTLRRPCALPVAPSLTMTLGSMRCLPRLCRRLGDLDSSGEWYLHCHSSGLVMLMAKLLH